MVLDKNTAKKTAEILLQINAIKLNAQSPFTWSSGWKSPIYCDNRIILSFPPIRNYVRDEMAKQIEQHFGKPDVIAGVATGAIGIGALIGETLGVPFVYVRPEPKKHGRQNQIEGYLESGQNTVVVEDLISTGNSSLNAVKALEKSGARVKGMMAIFSYTFEKARKNIEEHDLDLVLLSDYHHLVDQAHETGYLNNEELQLLRLWRENPSEWSPEKISE